MGAMALHGYSSMELKSRSFISKEPHVAREPQVADPCPTLIVASCEITFSDIQFLPLTIFSFPAVLGRLEYFIPGSETASHLVLSPPGHLRTPALHSTTAKGILVQRHSSHIFRGHAPTSRIILCTPNLLARCIISNAISSCYAH
jgi:hypothetical protein